LVLKGIFTFSFRLSHFDTLLDYFSLGFRHIVSLGGFDHLLFIIVLCAVYAPHEWRRVLLLLTGFTLGHSLTLGLTALQIVAFPSKWVEALIPLTILATSLSNVALPKPAGAGRPFGVATLFGLVHGCGFAGYFGMMLGDEQSILGPLFAFNLGLEAGQVLTVAVFYVFFYFFDKIRPFRLRDWALFVSGAGAGLALKMLLEIALNAPS
jgi:hypothetical protein